jgi:hypothetical protein
MGGCASDGSPKSITWCIIDGKSSVKSQSPPHSPSSGAGLALIPLLLAGVLFLLMIPRATLPDDIPLPKVDTRTLKARAQEEAVLFYNFERVGLSADVRALGTELRALHAAEGEGLLDVDAAQSKLSLLKEHVERARAVAVAKSGIEAVRTLFVVQKRAFVEQVALAEHAGDSDELRALAGDFMSRMQNAGWVRGKSKATGMHEVVLSQDELGVLYKAMWSHDVGLELDTWFELSLDEKRVLFSIYLAHPHVPDSMRQSFDGAAKHAVSPQECARVEQEREKAKEAWRAEKIAALGSFDESYPTGYALGIANYRMGKMLQAQTLLRGWLDKNPEGPLALRARNYLKETSRALEGR